MRPNFHRVISNNFSISIIVHCNADSYLDPSTVTSPSQATPPLQIQPSHRISRPLQARALHISRYRISPPGDDSSHRIDPHDVMDYES
ncbi:hypothetical protein B7494_g8481 [Chlorociboria aeruginascens]|nr:hypothetical protein B7494_g8481 [Chlorociboria aeruginascens]